MALLFCGLAAAAALVVFARRAARGGQTYRPEMHYMRGPGPKSRNKDAQVARRDH